MNGLGREWIADTNRVVLASAPEKPGVPVPSDEELLAAFGAVSAASIEPWADGPADPDSSDEEA